ncbi:AraC family transcriptional regulator [Klebsiella sp. BIGb0407]|uniref:AraC family transcriptional regulator n=1 Tax=Klebsiella sp. BIGb0407 TaxID=2940603 RepID=UPI002168852E|nr:AraC family transcriptional regulator [Klebsiella sp. BIGb0407]MCS3431427.1 AraC-like DNA-binding protein [Klebsiella sp. BIGb0407]
MSDERPIYEIIGTPVTELYNFRRDKINDFIGCYAVPHYHFMHEVMWFRESCGVFTINNKEYEIKNNTLIFVPALMIHDMLLFSESQHDRYLFQFEPYFLQQNSDVILSSQHSSPLVCYLDDTTAERINSAFAWSIEECQKNKYSALGMKLLSVLLEFVFSREYHQDTEIKHQPDTNIDTLIKYLYHLENTSHYEVATVDAASLCGWSTSYFARTFKKHFSMTFKEYLLLRKIRYAIRLLLSSDMSISDIALTAGFTDSAYFCMKFKRVMGYSPLTFRHDTLQGQILPDMVHPSNSIS